MAIQPRDILPSGRMVEIVRVDGETPGPPRRVPSALKPGMLARVVNAHQIGTNGSAVLMYELRVGSPPEQQGDPQPLYAQLYAADVNPLPMVEGAAASPALADARRRYENTEERSITDLELQKARKPLTFHATPALVAQEKAKAERAKVEAEAQRQAAIAKCRAEAEAAAKVAAPADGQPRFADGTQNDRLPVDMVKALAETGLK